MSSFFYLALFFGSFIPSAKAGLSYEFECVAIHEEEESSVLRVSISPSSSDLLNLSFEGEVNETYSREEVVQFKFDVLSHKRAELYLFVKAAEGKSGPNAFRVLARSSKSRSSLIGRIEHLELKDLAYRISHTSKIRCNEVK